MKKNIKILLFLVFVIVSFGVISMLLISKQYHFERVITVSATQSEVFEYIKSTKRFNEWNPWRKLDPSMSIKYFGKDGEIGDEYCWKGNKDVGEGCHVITNIVPNHFQQSKMTFKKPFESIGYSDIILIPLGKQTKVIWTLDCELDYPMNLMKFFMDKGMNKSYSEGLLNLKVLVENSTIK